ncbi:MAG: TAXI family TRAP transporter solute-binding subunit [Burkholderiales bacterium]
MKTHLTRAYARLEQLLGRGLLLALGLMLLVSLAVSLAAFGFFNAAAPTTLTLSGGPPGSAFQRYAERYQAILAKQGVKLKILPSQGSQQNLARLTDAKTEVDVGFVLGGELQGEAPAHLMSLGSVAYQPLMIFYRGAPKALLADFKGARLDIGPAGSGAHSLARTLLAANGIQDGDGTTFVDTRDEDTGRALRAGRIDAFFAMSDSTPMTLIRELLRTPGIHLYDVAQADGYVRRFNQLNKLFLPRGALDFGEDVPSDDVWLIGPTVELIARDSLHPALSDLLLEAAREVHGKAGLYKKRGEFPAPLEHEFRISPDATRYYAAGKSFLYRTFPFWLASLIARIVAVVVPLVLLLIPAFKIIPALYRWRTTSRIYRWYGDLQRLERDAHAPAVDAALRTELLKRLDHIEAAVQKIVVPPAFGDVFYALRGHIAAVRAGLRGAGFGGPAAGQPPVL